MTSTMSPPSSAFSRRGPCSLRRVKLTQEQTNRELGSLPFSAGPRYCYPCLFHGLTQQIHAFASCTFTNPVVEHQPQDHMAGWPVRGPSQNWGVLVQSV